MRLYIEFTGEEADVLGAAPADEDLVALGRYGVRAFYIRQNRSRLLNPATRDQYLQSLRGQGAAQG